MSTVTKTEKLKDLQFHEIANIFPLLPDEDLQQLADDIRLYGQREPIVLFEGKILDGRNRYKACLFAGVIPQTREFDGDKIDALAFVWSTNVHRRHLNSGAMGVAAAKREKLDEEYRKAVEAIADSQPKGGRPKKDEKPSQIIDEVLSNEKRTDHKLAKANGTNRTYLNDARKVLEKRPDLAEKVLAQEITLPQAKAEIKRGEKREELEAAAARIQQHESDMPTWSILNVDVIDGLESVRDEWGPVDLIFADPPYNIGIDYGDGEDADLLTDMQYMLWVKKWMSLCCECLSDDGSMWVMIGDEYAAEYGMAIKSLGLTIRNWVKWYETFGVNCSNKFNRCSRHLFYCVKDAKNFTFNAEFVTRPSDRQTKYNDARAALSGKVWDDVWSIPRLSGTCDERIPDFPTQLPLALVRPIVEACSMPGSLVLDPFNGSGTTGVASVQSNRKYVGIEKSERFADLATMRLKAASA
jgi:DNA modification methylase